MKGRLLALLAVAALVAVVGGFVGLWHINHSVIGEAKSPDGSLQAIAMMLNDVGEAPYGHAVMVVRWKWERYLEDPVFLGYCNRGIEVRWTSDQKLTVTCPGGRVEYAADGESAAVQVQVELRNVLR